MKPGRVSSRRSALRLASAALLSCLVPLAGATGCTEAVRPDLDRVDPLEVLSPGGDAPDVVRFGITPSTGDQIDDQLQPLLQYLKEHHDIEAEVSIAESYDALAVQVDKKQVHVGFFSPLAYVKARGTIPAVSIATASRAGSPTYLAYLVAKRDDPRRELMEFEGSKIAWVSRSSTSGYLYPRAMMRGRGLEPDAFFSNESFAGDHFTALDQVVSGDVDVAAVASAFVDSTEREGVLMMDKVRVVAKSDRIPLDSVVVHKDLARPLAIRLRVALLSLDQYPEHSSALSDSWGVSGFVRTDEARYDIIDDVLAAENQSAIPGR